MYKRVLMYMLMTSVILIFSSIPVSAASDIVGGINIEDGAETTEDRNVNLTISAGESASVSETETSQSDFQKGTHDDVKATSDDNLQLDEFLDGGFESGNFEKWDRADSGWEIVTDPVYSGNYAAKAVGNKNGIPYALMEHFDTPQEYGYFKSTVMFTENDERHIPFHATSGDGVSAFLLRARSNGHFEYHDGTGYKKFPVDTTYKANKWYTIEIYWYGNSSTYKVIIDSVDVTKGGIVMKERYGNLVKSIAKVYMKNTGVKGNGGMIVDDVYITTNTNPIMDDGFETGNFEEWDTISDSWESVSDPVFTGDYALRSNSKSALTKGFDENLKSGYFKTNARFTSTNDSHTVIRAREKGYGVLVSAFRDGHFRYYNGSGYKKFPVDTKYKANKWYTIEVYWKNGKFEVFIDGVNVTNGEIKMKSYFNEVIHKLEAIEIVSSSSTDGSMILDNILIDENKLPDPSIPAYEFSGSRISPAINLSPAGTAVDSSIEWTASTPDDTSISIDTSIDGGSTWKSATNGDKIPCIESGMDLSEKTLLIRQNLNTTNMEATPKLKDISIKVEGVTPADEDIEMIISNDSSFSGEEWESYKSSKSWTLGSKQGTKTVYIKFKDSDGNESIVYSDDIIYDDPVTLEEVYNKVRSKALVFTVVKDIEFKKIIYDQIAGSNADNTVNAEVVSVPDTDYKYTVLTGKLSTSGAHAVIINENLILFKVIAPPTSSSVSTVNFE